MRKRFLKLTKFPIMVVFGDNIPRDADKLDTRGAIRQRCLLWRDTVNKHGGNAQVLDLPDVGISGNTHYVFCGYECESGRRSNVTMAEEPGTGQLKP